MLGLQCSHSREINCKLEKGEKKGGYLFVVSFQECMVFYADILEYINREHISR